MHCGVVMLQVLLPLRLHFTEGREGGEDRQNC